MLASSIHLHNAKSRKQSLGPLSIAISAILMLLICSSVVVAGYVELSWAIAVFLPIATLLCVVAAPFVARDDVSFLRHILILCLLIRMFIVVYTYVWSRGVGGIGSQSLGLSDDGTWHNSASLIATKWNEEGFSVVPSSDIPSSIIGFPYILAVVYFAFGQDPVFGMLLNTVFGVITVALVYILGREVQGRNVGRWACIMVSFLPQMIIWSSWLAKDGLIAMCITGISLLAVRTLRSNANNVRSLLGSLLLMIIVLASLRPLTAYLVGIAVAVHFLLFLGSTKVKMISVIAFVVLGVLGLVVLSNIFQHEFLDFSGMLNLYSEESIEQRYSHFSYTENSVTQRVLGEISAEDFITRPQLFVPAVFLTLISPFPFWLAPETDSFTIGMFLEVNLTPLRYIIMLLAFVGIRLSYKEWNRQCILLSNLSILLLMSITVSFFGTHPRYLTQVLPLLTVLAAWSLEHLTRKQIMNIGAFCTIGIIFMATVYLAMK